MFVGILGVPRTSWDKHRCVFWVFAKIGGVLFFRVYEMRRMNIYVHKNKGNIAKFGSMLRRSREL